MDPNAKRNPEDRASRAPLIRKNYTDDTGRMWAVLIPDDHDADPSMGIPIGPPDLTGLYLPEETAVRLHNQLFARGILTKADLKSKQRELFAALQAAYKVDIAKVTQMFD